MHGNLIYFKPFLAILTIVAKRPMANAGTNNQVFIISWVSELAEG